MQADEGGQTKEGKEICNAFYDKRGCQKTDCKKEHVCDVLNPDKDCACGGRNHNRETHRGRSVPL